MFFQAQNWLAELLPGSPYGWAAQPVFPKTTGLGTIYANPTTKTPFKNASLHHLSGLCGSRVSWGILWPSNWKDQFSPFLHLGSLCFLILGTHCCIFQTPAWFIWRESWLWGLISLSLNSSSLLTWVVLKKACNLSDPVFSSVNGGKDNVVTVS